MQMIVIRAEIIGDNYICCAFTTNSLPDLCRKLVEAGYPAIRLEVFRGGEIPCLIVPWIRQAADLEINAKGTGFVRRRAAVRTASPVSVSDCPVGGQPSEQETHVRAGGHV
jgi:hypothetical protein